MQNKPHVNWTYCGAKTRSGQPCKGKAMPNGRCRLHGGKSTGAPPEKMRQNKNAVKTGEHETIWLDTLEDDERVLFDVIQTDVLKQLDEEIRLMTIRERRMMRRIAELKQHEFTVVKHSQGVEKGQETDLKEAEGTLGQIQNIEEALTRVQEKKGKLLELKHKIESASEGDDSDKLDDLLKVMMANAAAIQSKTS